MNWVGVIGGWALGAFFIMLPMYRAGMYTNAEYLEARFGVAVRVICAFVQVQYRTLVLGLIATAAFLTLSIISGWSDSAAWGLVGGIAVLAAIYTAFGGSDGFPAIWRDDAGRFASLVYGVGAGRRLGWNRRKTGGTRIWSGDADAEDGQ